MNIKKATYILIYLTIIISCKSPFTISKIQKENILINSIQPKNEIENIINPYNDKLTTKTEEILTFTPEDLTKQNGNLQNVFSDITFEESKDIFKKKYNKDADFALINEGSLRTIVPEGNVTVGEIYEVMPFDNKIVVVGIKGYKMIELINYLIQKPQPISNITVDKNNKSAKICGANFKPDKTYYVITYDYLQKGGDNMSFFKKPKELYPLNTLARDIYLNYFNRIDTVVIDKTIRYQ